MSNLKQRVEKLEKVHGTEGDVGAWLDRVVGPEIREYLRGHEAEFEGFARDGGDLMTFECLNRIYHYFPENVKRRCDEDYRREKEAGYSAQRP